MFEANVRPANAGEQAAKLSIEDKAMALFSWYQNEKAVFSNDVYMNKGGEWSRLLWPYSQWSTSEVLRRERNFILVTQANLSKYLSGYERSRLKKELNLVILSLKHRMEFASQQSDVYPVFAAVVAFAIGLCSIEQPLAFKLILGTAGLFFVGNSFNCRIKT